MLIQLLQLRLPRSKPAFDELVTDCFNVIYKNSHCNWKPHPDEWIRNSTIPVDATVERHGVVRYWQIFGPYGIFRMRSIKKESKTFNWFFHQLVDLAINYYCVLVMDLYRYTLDFSDDSTTEEIDVDHVEHKWFNGSNYTN